MGLIKAILNAGKTALGDQFKEYVTKPDSAANDVLIVRGEVHHGVGNPNASEGIISNGSLIVVPVGWAMMLVDNGKVEFCADPGEYTYDNGSEPSIFYGGLGKGILDTLKTIGNRFTFGGQTAKDQRVYYVNLMEVTGNKFGSSSPKEVYDEFYQRTIEITFRGQYTYKIENPAALIATVMGAQPKDRVTFAEVFGDQLKSDVNEQMHKALTIVMQENKIKFSALGAYGPDLSNALNGALNAKWQNYGVLITAVSMEDIGATDEYKAQIAELEDARNKEMAMADAEAYKTRVVGQAEADKTKAMAEAYSSNMQGAMGAATGQAMMNAAGNDNGAWMGFAGMNMATQAGNNVLGTVAAMGGNAQGAPAAEGAEAAPVEGGKVPNFCPNCGAPTNGANFCGNCGAKLN